MIANHKRVGYRVQKYHISVNPFYLAQLGSRDAILQEMAKPEDWVWNAQLTTLDWMIMELTQAEARILGKAKKAELDGAKATPESAPSTACLE